MIELTIQTWTALAITLMAAAFDLRTRHIPNAVTVGGIAVGVALHAAVGWAEDGAPGLARGAGLSLAGLVVCGAFPALGFARGELGGGDVKLFAAIGALCGPGLGFDAEAFAFAVALAIVLPVRLVAERKAGAAFANTCAALRNAFPWTAPKRPYRALGLPPVVLAPTILAGLCLAILRHEVLP